MKQQPFLHKVYKEGLDLLMSARQYFSRHGKSYLKTLEKNARFDVVNASCQLTNYLTHIMAWMLLQKSVVEGAEKTDTMQDEMDRLVEEVPPLKNSIKMAESLPNQLKLLLTQSKELYERVGRLNEMLRAEP